MGNKSVTTLIEIPSLIESPIPIPNIPIPHLRAHCEWWGKSSQLGCDMLQSFGKDAVMQGSETFY